MAEQLSAAPPLTEGGSSDPVPTRSLLKRRVSSPSFETLSRKRIKDDNTLADDAANHFNSVSFESFLDELSEQLYCGCCSDLVYKPVLVMPCQHFFCGSCCIHWIRNGGTNCPACRSMATVAVPFRAIQPFIDSLLRKAPNRTRTKRERDQADEIYKSGQPIRFPPPREASPAPDMERSADYVHPCPHCPANNPYEWRCPQPVPDPVTDPDNAWHADDGVPPGHAHCGNCENLLALRAPCTTKCDLCQVSFCGIGVQDRCVAAPILSQQPHNLFTHTDLIQSTDVYESFGGNTVEVEIMLEYVEAQKLTPRHIYRDIVQHIQKQPGGFRFLIELDLFSDIHSVAPSGQAAPDAPRNRACRPCAAEIFFWGLKTWWIRERQKGFLEEGIMNRKDCPEGSSCTRQRDDHTHAREFNHIFGSPLSDALGPPNHQLHDTNIQRSTSATPSTSTGNANSSASLPSSSSASSLSFLLNAEDVSGQSPSHHPSISDMCDVDMLS